MPAIRIELFGGPRVVGPHALDGTMPRLSPYQAHLLSILCLEGRRGVSRQRLAWLLWEDDAVSTIRHRLRQLLHGLRRRVDAGVVVARGPDTLAVDPHHVSCDVWLLQDHLAAGRLQAAAELFTAPLLAGPPPPPTREYADWAGARERSLRTSLEDRARVVVAEAREEADWIRFRDAAEALLLLRPDDDDAVRNVVEGRGLSGRRHAAEAAFTRYVERCRREDRPPDDGVVETMERVRRLAEDDERHERSPVPLVGRTGPLACLRRHLDRTEDGSMQIVVVSGEAGVGKTRLLEEVVREARVRGFRCLSARPAELEQHLALNVVTDALRCMDAAPLVQGLGEPWRTIIASFLPPDPRIDTLERVPPIQESSLSRRLLDAFSMLLTAVAVDEPTVMFIDDLHWADETSLAVLQFARRRWGRGALTVMGSVRSDAAHPRSGTSRYLRELLAFGTHVVRLEDLDDDDALELVRRVGEASLPDAAAHRLAALGGANPFYLIELTEDYRAGRLRLPEVATEPVVLPMSLQELFQNRMRSLGETAERVMQLLAIRTKPLSIRQLAKLGGISLDECAHGIDELVGRRLVRVDSGSVRLAHDLFRSAVAQGLSPARSALLHLRVAEALDSGAEAPDGELAVHFAKAGEKERAVIHARRAADEAVERGAIAEATYFLRIVVDHEHRETPRAEATADLGRLLHVNREMARAAPVLQVAARRLRTVGRTARALRMEVRRVESLVEIEETPAADAVARLGEIREEARDAEDWAAVAMALDTEMHLHHQVGNVEAIRSLFTLMRECARKESAEARCLANAGLALNVLFGDPEEGLTCARTAVRIAEEESLSEHLLMAQTRALLALIQRGMIQLPETQALAKRAQVTAKKDGDLALRFFLQLNLGVAQMDIGELDKARVALARAAKILKGVQEDSTRVKLEYNLAELEMLSCEYEEALARFTRVEAAMGLRPYGEINTLVDAGIGFCSIQLGQLGEAREREERIAPDYISEHTHNPFPVVAFSARMMCRRGQVLEALAFVAERAEIVRDRSPVAWMNLQGLAAELATRAGVPTPSSVQEAREQAASLCLVGLARHLNLAG